MDHVDHILIVDDDREIRELVGNYLKKNGMRTTVVADVRQMRSFLDTTPVDLIALDIMMPGDDGLQLCRELRVGKHKATPVLMLTARNDDRSIDLLDSCLRQRLLDDAREPAYIKTVRSEGYVFSLAVEILGATQ
jgi:DNA-binding response OmpR family regulator